MAGELLDIAARSSSGVGMRSAAANRFLPKVRIIKPEIIEKSNTIKKGQLYVSRISLDIQDSSYLPFIACTME